MVDLFLTRACAGGRHNQIGVIGEFEYLVNRVYRMQVGRSDSVRLICQIIYTYGLDREWVTATSTVK